MQPRIYTYKITFEEVPYYYYGVHKEKRYDEYYMGSPVTNKWCWNFYTPKKQILELFATREQANKVENRLIKPFINDSNCLNENCGGIVSSTMCKKGAKKLVENKLGIHSRTREQIIEDGNKGRETQKRLKLGIFGLSAEIRKENGKKLAQKNIESGHIQKLGKKWGNLCKNNKIGIFSLTEEERKLAGKRGGKISGNKAYKNKTGIHSFNKQQRIDIGKKGGNKNKESGHIQNIGKKQVKKLNSEKWMCLVTNHITTAGPLTVYQKARNIDTSLRVKIQI